MLHRCNNLSNRWAASFGRSCRRLASSYKGLAWWKPVEAKGFCTAAGAGNEASAWRLLQAAGAAGGSGKSLLEWVMEQDANTGFVMLTTAVAGMCWRDEAAFRCEQGGRVRLVAAMIPAISRGTFGWGPHDVAWVACSAGPCFLTAPFTARSS